MGYIIIPSYPSLHSSLWQAQVTKDLQLGEVIPTKKLCVMISMPRVGRYMYTCIANMKPIQLRVPILQCCWAHTSALAFLHWSMVLSLWCLKNSTHNIWTYFQTIHISITIQIGYHDHRVLINYSALRTLYNQNFQGWTKFLGEGVGGRGGGGDQLSAVSGARSWLLRQWITVCDYMTVPANC